MSDYKKYIMPYWCVWKKCSQLKIETQKAIIKNKNILSFIQNDRININLIENEVENKRKFYFEAKRAYKDFNNLIFMIFELKELIPLNSYKKLKLPFLFSGKTLDILLREFKMICSRLDFNNPVDLDCRSTVAESINAIQKVLKIDYIDIND